MAQAIAATGPAPRTLGWRRYHLVARSRRLGSGAWVLGRSSRNLWRSSAISEARAYRREGSGSSALAMIASRLGGIAGLIDRADGAPFLRSSVIRDTTWKMVSPG